MGDLIQKLPTDNILLTQEERENFIMLFPNEQSSSYQQPQPQPLPPNPASGPQKLKKEFMSIALFIAVFFLLNMPYIKNLIVEYIPMCNKSWIVANIVQAIVFAFILWIAVNAEYSRV